ncbi:MAG TPA: tRNA guanosine(34) transglycosylase Tgt [Candidatus Nanoarchaeia archaeon]|nr:tRNA guanosine(34) transglycosylase Tgt [Candidatus Nanoarchaeia archaeon]
MSLKFTIQKTLPGTMARTGTIETKHGVIKTPAFVPVATKGTIKALTPEQVKDLGAQVVLANTYHLFLQPGDELVRDAGGLHKFMNWNGPTMTDSGGFQVFSLGAAYGKGISKVTKKQDEELLLADSKERDETPKIASIDPNGVTFRSHLDGSAHYFTPEKSIEIQHNLGADMIFAFDECTSPQESNHYQREALDRTHRWAKRSLDHHKKLKEQGNGTHISLFGIVQGGRSEVLRKESAQYIGGLDFDGFGIGGSFAKEDMTTAVQWVNEILPKEKPKHLLGIGEPEDLFMGVENGVDLFDCVAATRIARNGGLYTTNGKIHLMNARFTKDFSKPDENCECYTCTNYTKAYVSHLFRADEMLAATLASIHNLYFIIHLVDNIRKSIEEGNFQEFKKEFLSTYQK